MTELELGWGIDVKERTGKYRARVGGTEYECGKYVTVTDRNYSRQRHNSYLTDCNLKDFKLALGRGITVIRDLSVPETVTYSHIKGWGE